MPSYAGSIGTDYSFGYFDTNTNSLIDLGDVQSVKISAMKHDLKNSPYNGPPKYDFVPDGYRISFTITREDSTLENLAVIREASFNAGGINRAGYLNQTVKNNDGSVTRYQYTGFTFFMSDHGDVSREKTVTLQCEGMASTKVLLS